MDWAFELTKANLVVPSVSIWWTSRMEQGRDDLESRQLTTLTTLTFPLMDAHVDARRHPAAERHCCCYSK